MFCQNFIFIMGDFVEILFNVKLFYFKGYCGGKGEIIFLIKSGMLKQNNMEVDLIICISKIKQ